MAETQREDGQGFSAEQRAAIRTMGRRRRRVIINVAAIVIATAGMATVSMIHRDQQTLTRAREAMSVVTQEFQEHYVGKPLPSELLAGDQFAEWRSSWRERVIYVPRNQFSSFENKPKAVCYLSSPFYQFFGDDGRFVVLYDGKKYTRVLVSERVFREKAKDWGIVLSVGKK